jgi:hypothetical protein
LSKYCATTLADEEHEYQKKARNVIGKSKQGERFLHHANLTGLGKREIYPPKKSNSSPYVLYMYGNS